MAKFSNILYRKCACGETAHDGKYDRRREGIVWACRNCGALARDRRGQVRTYIPDPIGSLMRSI